MLVPICFYCLNCTKFGQLILRKIIKIIATRCQLLRLKCIKFYWEPLRGREGRGKGRDGKGKGERWGGEGGGGNGEKGKGSRREGERGRGNRRDGR